MLQEVSVIDSDLWNLTRFNLARAEREPTLTPFEHEGLAEKMRYVDDLYESNFLARFRKKGVMRIYFCFDLTERNLIWLLDAERKTEKKKSAKESAIAQWSIGW